MTKQTDKDTQKEHKHTKVNMFQLFCNRFTYYGAIAILISIIITLIVKENTWKYGWVLDIVSSFFCTAGIAMFLGAFFDLAKNSKEFVQIVSDILTNIVVSKAFLNTLGEKDKRQAMEIILKPSGNQLQQYSNINGYFQKKVDESIQILDTNFKSNLNVYVDVYKENDRVVAKSMLRYRIYKINNKFERIQTWFEHEDSEFLSTKIFYENKSIEIKKDDIKEPQKNDESSVHNVSSKKTYFEVPEELNSCPYLTVEYNILEKGYDHWINFHWTSLTPYDGIDFQLRCNNNLEIKEVYLFDDNDGLRYKIDNSKENVSIISTTWQNCFTGFVVTVADRATI